MPVEARDLRYYGSANMQDTDSGTQGGAIATSKKPIFSDVAPAGGLKIVSSNAGDTTQTVTTTGRDASGAIIADTKTLNGLTPVNHTGTFDRILKAVKSATCAGDVAVMEQTLDENGTAQGGAASTVTLRAGASGSDDAYNGKVIRIVANTGAGQLRVIHDYVGSSKVATVDRDWTTPPDATSTYEITDGVLFDKSPHEILEVRRPFYNAAADAAGGSTRNYYEKIFVKNGHGSLSLTSATVAEASDPSGKVTFGLAGTLDDTATTTNRVTAPGGITFDNSTKNVANSQNLTNGAAQSIWMNLTLAAGDAPQEFVWQVRTAGQTT